MTPPSGISGELLTGFELFRRQLSVADRFKGSPQRLAYSIPCTIREHQLFTDGQPANFDADYVILTNGELRFGRGHYFLSEMAEFVQSAGGVTVIDGKIAYLDNESGHYHPDIEDLKDARDFFTQNQLTSDDLMVCEVVF